MASRAAENRQVAADLRSKLRLEATFKPEVKSLFFRIVKEFAVKIAATGIPSEAIKHRNDWEAVLRKHYERTQRVFRGVVASQQKGYKAEAQSDTEKDAMIGLALLKWRDENAPISAREITETTQKNFTGALNQARELIEEQELPSDHRTLALTAVPLLKRKFKGRTETIITFETQQAAESTKAIEATVLSDITPLSPPEDVARLTMLWRTVGDDKVRPAHRAANYQLRRINEPFDVGGEQLRYAGDRSLGASIGNIAGCRCSIQYRTPLARL